MKNLWCVVCSIAALLCPTVAAQEGWQLDTLIRPGNALRIAIVPDAENFLNGVYPIDDKGYILLPITGLVPVTKKSTGELQEYIEREFVDYLRYPNIQITPLMRVSLHGGFHAPGSFWVDPRSSLWDLVALGKGVQREDGIRRLRWERDREPVEKDLVPHYQSGESLLALGFRSGDQLRVSPRPQRTGLEVLRGDVVPAVTALATLVTTSLSLIQMYRFYQER